MEPRYVLRAAFEGWRDARGLSAAFEGLWVRGTPEALARPCVAIVGTRAASAYGRRLAREFAGEIGRVGCCVISGLALGIDAAAHEGALDAQAPTVGVLGGGHGCFFPERNAGLAERMIAAGGAVLSPYAPQQPAQGFQFLARNAIVAGLADALVVIEAPARSGALNTASWAAGHIPVLAVPGDVDRRHVAGCHALIRDGAILARCAADVLEVLPLDAPSAPDVRREQPDPQLRGILAALAEGERDLDQLVAACEMDAAPLLGALAVLELDGFVQSREGARYSLA